MDSPDRLLSLLSTSVFYFLVFSVFTLFSCRFRAVDKAAHVGFRANDKIASRIVSYRKIRRTGDASSRD